MKVQAIMTTDIGFCNLADNLTKAAEIMWQKDCGVVPIVDEDRKVVGMITDRDICIATATRNQTPSDIAAQEMINGEVICCAADDKIETALKKMKKNQLKRLPITDANGELVGILSIADVLSCGRKAKKLRKQIYSTLKAIGTPRPIVLKEMTGQAKDLFANVQ